MRLYEYQSGLGSELWGLDVLDRRERHLQHRDENYSRIDECTTSSVNFFFLPFFSWLFKIRQRAPQSSHSSYEALHLRTIALVDTFKACAMIDGIIFARFVAMITHLSLNIFSASLSFSTANRSIIFTEFPGGVLDIWPLRSS
jgi:hypothetical protein